MRKQLMIPALLALSVALAACSTPPNANLENARTNYSALQANPQATKVAALETKDASEWLDKADKAYLNKEDEKKVDQLAYLTNQRIEVAKQTIALRTAETQLKDAGDQRAKALLDARDAQIKQLQSSLNAKQTDRGTLVTFGDVLFATNKADLKSNGLVNINKLAQFLRDNPDRKVIVEGYTDSTGSAAYNQSLSERRATSVQVALIKMGVDPARIVAQGYGKQYPVADNGSVSGRAMNRRVEVTISNDNQPVAPRSAISAN
ncbi:OmpA family protein [Pseudomonas chlororaphis]|uniref:OmpA family protein n=1 Tax=Pseudomonas chlororaphis TaxID=587753 RepID=UPI0006A57A8F|nr:OmpA family protein [Pseudomonas chlororaphis]AZC29146.1 Outer membrane protein [Pseudomonas chlororaphis subsp. piscium]MBP5074127.1 OmpA family protein [Pseudomonas chlororaphis]QTT90705.1 OmpA family protein [Pseudomonas chlororaphis]WDG80133.1 OmpA family protein [Pseudomonas chlororaphis]WDG86813.1 OmpA family protein [Pseudomonas chlororaphis]